MSCGRGMGRRSMNDRERILAMLAGGRPDRVPWFGDLTYWAGAMESRGEVPADWQRHPDYYRFHRELGVGFYLQGYFAYRAVTEGDIVIDERTRGDLRTRTVQTPVGTLTEASRYLPLSYTWAPSRHMVSTPADLRALRYWWAHTHYLPNVEEAVRRRPWVDDLGVVLCYLPRSPFMQLTAELAGIGNVVELWSEARDEFEETLRVMEESADRAAEVALATPVDCLMIPENLSSEVVGRRFYAQYMLPYEQKWTARIRSAGKYSFVHMDGTLRGLLAQVGAAGFDVIEAVTPTPVGDLPMSALRALAGPGPVLWGGLPGVYFTPLVSDAEFERFVRETLAVMVADERMVLGVGDQVPPDGLRARVARVVELVEHYGAYAQAST
jgi:hypothetical protein